MGKWDKLSRRGVQGSGAFMLLFGEFFLFFHLAKVQKKGTCERKTGLGVEREAAFHRTVGGTYV